MPVGTWHIDRRNLKPTIETRDKKGVYECEIGCGVFPAQKTWFIAFAIDWTAEQLYLRKGQGRGQIPSDNTWEYVVGQIKKVFRVGGSTVASITSLNELMQNRPCACLFWTTRTLATFSRFWKNPPRDARCPPPEMAPMTTDASWASWCNPLHLPRDAFFGPPREFGTEMVPTTVVPWVPLSSVEGATAHKLSQPTGANVMRYLSTVPKKRTTVNVKLSVTGGKTEIHRQTQSLHRRWQDQCLSRECNKFNLSSLLRLALGFSL